MIEGPRNGSEPAREQQRECSVRTADQADRLSELPKRPFDQIAQTKQFDSDQ